MKRDPLVRTILDRSQFYQWSITFLEIFLTKIDNYLERSEMLKTIQYGL